MSYGLNLGWGGPIGDYIGFWGGPIKRYTTKLVQGSYVLLSVLLLYPCTGIIIAVLRIFLLLPPLPF